MAGQRKIVTALLRRLGYTVDTAASGEAAIRSVRAQSYDLLLIDMIMAPGMDGIETYRRVLAIRPHQPAIIASGYSQTERVRQAIKCGASAYLRKPYTLKLLGQAVKQALANASANTATEVGGRRD